MWPASDSDRRTPEAPVLAYFWGNLECPASEYNRGTPETRERESSLFKYFFLPKHTNEILVYFQIIRIFFNLSDADRESVEKDPELQSAIRWQVDLETQYADRSQNPALRATSPQFAPASARQTAERNTPRFQSETGGD